MRRSVMGSGLMSVGSGVLAAGVCTYLFLSLAGRVLGPVGLSPVSSLWAMVFIVGPGLFLPLQQELGRLISQHRPDRVGRRALTRVSALAVGLAGLAMSLTALFATTITDRLLGGDWALLAWFEVSIAAYAFGFVARGTLSGLGDYRRLGVLVVVEAGLRLLIAAGLCLVGLRSAGSFGAAIALAPLVATLVVMRGRAAFALSPGPELPWLDAVRAVSLLAGASLLAQFVANAGPLFVQALASPAQADAAGRFLGALVIARLALYLFQAVQATLLPNLAALLADSGDRAFRRELRRLVQLCLGLVVASVIGGYALGPLAVTTVFGDGFEVPRSTMATLAGATGVYVLAASLSGAAIAAARHALATSAWLAGAVAFTVVTMADGDLLRRVELGYLAGSTAAALVLVIGVRRHRPVGDGGVSGGPSRQSPPGRETR